MTTNPGAARDAAAAPSEPMSLHNDLTPSIPWNRAVSEAGARVAKFVAQHPRGLTAAVAVMLAGFGAAAFGIAPMVDPVLPPKQLVTETVVPDGFDAQIEALAEQDLQLYRSDLTRSSDTADTLLRRLSVDDEQAAAFLRADPVARKLLEGRAGKMVRVSKNASGQLEELVARYAALDSSLTATHFTRLRVSRAGGSFRATVETAPLASQVRMGSGTIQTSLFAATDEARLPDVVASQLAEIFSTDIDFHRELRKGDMFTVVYEALTADGEPITWNATGGRVVAAEFVNDGKRFSAVWFKDAQGRGSYFDMNGQSKRRSFLSSPMEFSRVTSGFAMRMHPILNTWKQHKGVDYGAPAGTPVRAVGDGVIEFAGWQNGYGNIVEIQHSHDRSTVYAHLSRIDVHRGQRVDQGTNIGAVGSTGWATGPHLHFEVKLHNVQQDPMLLAKASEAVAVSPDEKAQFALFVRSTRGQLEAAESAARAGSYSE